MHDPARDVERARHLLRGAEVVLLDMNGTFMFGEDRLDAGQDFGATYRALGGESLSGQAVNDRVLACVSCMARLYEDPAFEDDFPSLHQVLDAPGLSARDRDLLVDVIGQHELGSIPEAHVRAVRVIGQNRRLGLVANIWAPKLPWLAELERTGLGDAFGARVFSSDGRSIKPARGPFEQALRELAVDPGDYDRVVFVGDSLRCDVAGAKRLGIRAIWIDAEDAGWPSAAPLPDARIGNLLELAV